MTKFSIIIPLYNKEAYIEKTVVSILNQTFTDWELIIVNDGSTDKSLEVLQRLSYCGKQLSIKTKVPLLSASINGVKYELVENKIFLIDQVNGGEATARNSGILESSTDLITFLDADDWWEPTFLEEMDKLIARYPKNGLWSSTHYNYRYGIANECEVLGLSPGFQQGEINYASISKYANKPICVGSVVLDKQIYLTEGGFNKKLKLGPDFDPFFRIAMKHGMALLNKPLMVYNNDVSVKTRAAGERFYKKEEHVAFNLTYPNIEYTDDIIYLFEMIKLRSLYKYYVHSHYLDEIREEMKGVNWKHHHWSYYFKYKIVPIFLLKLSWDFSKFGSQIKQRAIWKRRKSE